MITSQVEQENLELTKRGFEAFGAADMATLTTLIHPDATWHETPVGVLAGNYHGRDAIFAYFGQLQQETAGTMRVKVVSMAASGDQVFVRSEVTAERLGKSLKTDHVQIFTITDGQVTNVVLATTDHPADAAFWS